MLDFKARKEVLDKYTKIYQQEVCEIKVFLLKLVQFSLTKYVREWRQMIEETRK